MKNPCAKSRKATEPPYCVFNTPFGPAKVLKFWSVPKGTASDAYARVFVSCNGDLGDAYLCDYLRYGWPSAISPEAALILAEWNRLYPDSTFPKPSLPF